MILFFIFSVYNRPYRLPSPRSPRFFYSFANIPHSITFKKTLVQAAFSAVFSEKDKKKFHFSFFSIHIPSLTVYIRHHTYASIISDIHHSHIQRMFHASHLKRNGKKLMAKKKNMPGLAANFMPNKVKILTQQLFLFDRVTRNVASPTFPFISSHLT